jgi:hypothetical protein
VPFGVGVYIAGAILFFSSGAFANPTATMGRSLATRSRASPRIRTDVRDRAVRWGRSGPGRRAVPVSKSFNQAGR